MLGVLMLCRHVTGLVTSVALTVLLPNELRGLSIGAFIAVAGLIGFGIAPSLVALVSKLLGGEQHLARGTGDRRRCWSASSRWSASGWR